MTGLGSPVLQPLRLRWHTRLFDFHGRPLGLDVCARPTRAPQDSAPVAARTCHSWSQEHLLAPPFASDPVSCPPPRVRAPKRGLCALAAALKVQLARAQDLMASQPAMAIFEKSDTSQKLFCGGLPGMITTEDLRLHFEKFGTLDECVVKHSPGNVGNAFARLPLIARQR